MSIYKKTINEEDLVHGRYYAGNCRNAQVARWDATVKKFFYNRFKFGHTFVEEIDHIDRVLDTHWDGFEPFHPIEEPEERISIPDEVHVALQEITDLGQLLQPKEYDTTKGTP